MPRSCNSFNNLLTGVLRWNGTLYCDCEIIRSSLRGIGISADFIRRILSTELRYFEMSLFNHDSCELLLLSLITISCFSESAFPAIVCLLVENLRTTSFTLGNLLLQLGLVCVSKLNDCYLFRVDFTQVWDWTIVFLQNSNDRLIAAESCESWIAMMRFTLVW